MDLDAMFNDMLGDLAQISQQLEDNAPTKVESKPVKHIPSVVAASDVSSDAVSDADLSAMLSDLTDWEQNLMAPSSSSGSKVSVGDDYQQSSGDLQPSQSSEMLHPSYGLDVYPQFNTLKRSAKDGPSVTYDDGDLSLESLGKDIDKQNQDKARQLSVEELAALTPVIQELDDLVNDLSNIGFLQTSDQNISSSANKVTPRTATTANNNFNFPTPSPQRTGSLPKRRPSVPETSYPINNRRNSAKESSLPRTVRFNNESTQQIRRQSLEDLNKSNRPVISKPKPPPKPPVSSKPQLPKKPQDFPPPPRPSKPKPPSPSPLKRQGSAKAPENLSSILERQLQQRAAHNERRISRSSTSSETTSDSVLYHQPTSFNQQHLQQNISEITSHSVPISKHSSMVSVTSSLSASSVASARSDSSTESGSVDQSHHAGDHANDKRVPDDIRNLMNALHHSKKVKDMSLEEKEERMKNEKMRIALEKLKEARIQKIHVKVFNKDESSKTIVVDERMTTRAVISQLLEKNHFDKSVNWALVEELPSLYMERIFEEHEIVTEMISLWTRDTKNQIRFLERKDKYALFRNPQHYLLSVSDSEKQLAERQKLTLIQEFFSGQTGTGVPEVEGFLYIKGESKSWNKKYCVLRSSGLYFSKSGEPKKGKKLADLQCLVMFEQVCVYLGRGWKKKYKSPTDYGFSLKHPAIQTKSKHIRYFCCDDVRSLMRWIVGIRCAKYGKQLKDNYDRTDAEVKAQGMTTPVSTLPRQREESTNAEQPDIPRPSITNMFGGAWQRANQEETQSSGGDVQRSKSVWKSGNTKSTSSNWWDLGAGPELKDLADETIASNQTKPSAHSELPPPPPPSTKPTNSQPPPPPKKPPTMQRLDESRFPTPPPPVDDIPPPPPLDDMPPPPAMDDLPPPPPIDDEMPLPPPMPLATGHAPPRFSGNAGGPQPVRLPFLPMFKNGNNLSRLQQPQPPRRPGPPPHPSRNSNESNNKAVFRPVVNNNMQKKPQPTSPPRPPLTAYYTNTIKNSAAIPFAASDLPPAPEFITDLKDTFYSMSNGLCGGVDNLDDFPPPPPELLLNEVKSRKNQQIVHKKSFKSAPPPPRRSASTKLSFKRA